MTEIDDLVSRLRSITGYLAVTPLPVPVAAAAPLPAEKQIHADSLLILQQSLRRHPCFGAFGLTRQEVDCQLLKELEDAAAAPAAVLDAANSDTSESLAWRLFVNDAADALELERLSGVFHDPVKRLEQAKEALYARLGVEAVPQLSQVGDSYPCPWNILATLESGVLFSQDSFRDVAKAQLEVPNATTGILTQLHRVYADTYHTMAWLQLLHQMMGFPVASVRPVWQAALYHFPTAAPLACVYVRLEMAALARKPRLDACRSEKDAQEVYRDYLRLLNTFYRHLPLTFSCELYSLFFMLVTEYIQPDSTSLDLLYRTCLRRDVGMLPQSTSLWVQYLSWRSATIRDYTRRREWRKRMFRRILSIPLLGLDAIKEEYDLFVATEYRGRVTPDEKIEVEKRLARVKTEADDLSHLMYFFYPTEWEPASTTAAVAFPHTLYLARPLTVDGPADLSSIKESVLSRIEMDLLASWHTLLQRIRAPLFPGSGGDVLHYSRCRSFMTMMACYFPHQPTLWMELIDFCVHQQPLLSDTERFSSVAAAMELALTFHRHDVCVRLFVANTYVTDFAAADLAFRDLKEALLYLRGWLLHYVRRDDAAAQSATPQRVEAQEAEEAEVLEKLQHITVLAVNFMRMGYAQGDAQHISLVARFVMHQVDFLSLTMAIVRKLLKAHRIDFPAQFLRPFHVFCSQWIALELIRNRATSSAVLMLQQWCEHLKTMLRSGKSKAWTCAECGVDELVLDACASLMTADPSSGPAVEVALAQLEALVSEPRDNFLYLARQLRHKFFLPFHAPQPEDTSDVRLTAKLLLPHSAPHRCDTVQFRCPPPAPLDAAEGYTNAATTATSSPMPPSLPEARATAEAAAATAEEQAQRAELDNEDIAEDPAIEQSTFPEENLWSSAVSFRYSNTPTKPRFDRPRRPPVPGRFADLADNALPRELPRVPQSAPSKLAVVSQSVQLPTLLDCLTAGWSVLLSEGERGKAPATKLPPLDQLENLLTELPSVYEYNPDVEEGGQDVSTEWVLRTLLSCEALS